MPDADLDSRIFTDPEAVVANAQGAQAFASYILGAHGGELENDREVRDRLCEGLEAVHFVLSQLRSPSTLETLLLRDIAQLVDEQAGARFRERGTAFDERFADAGALAL